MSAADMPLAPKARCLSLPLGDAARMPLVTNGAPSSVAAVDLRKRRREEKGVLMGAKIRTEWPELHAGLLSSRLKGGPSGPKGRRGPALWPASAWSARWRPSSHALV